VPLICCKGWEVSFAEHSSSHALRVAALGHRVISPKTRDAVARAAECATAMQQQSQSFDHARHGIDVDLQLRIAIHQGPAHPVRDPILNKDSFAGREIIRAARIEPVTRRGRFMPPNNWPARCS
jgi:class 3 adenylate cyclase